MKSPSSHADAPTLTSLLRMSEGCQRFHVGGILVQTHEQSAYSPIFWEYTVCTIYKADL